MCGIAGYIGKEIIEDTTIKKTLELMRNRGPDNQDYIKIKDGDINILLLNSRLCIIDLDKRSNQPFIIDDNFITYNGEIYNYIELREKLKNNVRFNTESDTEVLLQSYINYGEKCVDYFEGMWAFAIYDKKRKKLFLSRDRFGEKPLYYSKQKNGIFFGSETRFIKSLTKQKFKINMKQVFKYLANGYKSLYKTNETFFEKIIRLPLSCNMRINKDLKIDISKFWHPSFHPNNISKNECINNFKSALLNSVKLRLRSDVPLAFCLSGGIDSASLVSIAAKKYDYDVATFSIIDTDERYNELDNIMATVEDIGCKNKQIYIPKDDFFKKLKNLIDYHDQPISTISYYIHSFLSESISKSGYKVAISGTAADELVTGYYDHYNLFLYEMRNSSNYNKYFNNWKKTFGKNVRNPYLKNPELYFNNPDFRDHIYLNNKEFESFLTSDFSEPFYEEKYSNSLLRNRMLNELFHESIPVILHEDDLNSMFYSIENRSPYLDLNLFKISYSIPNEYLIQEGYAKYILRESMKGILNEKVRNDWKKVGFNASINSLLDLKDEKIKHYLLKNWKIYNFVKKHKIEKIIDKDPMPNSYSKFLFSFINSCFFLEKNEEDEYDKN